MKSIKIMKGDITQITVDAIVNAANTSLLGGGGVDGAIHRRGGVSILADCQKIRAKQGGCAVGEAVVTTAGNLPAKYVIHTVGPTWVDGQHQEEKLLESAYRNSFKLAEEMKLQSLAFPNISTGIYRFPKLFAAQIALKTIAEELSKAVLVQQVIFVCFDDENFNIYQSLQQDFDLL
ncbi:O-acetyl-ADP-ribose deacetylase [Acinetobacter sp. C26M]|uniref:O-acetyl-ADP-ribose deacetylase n=1 Tax=unclassified Acinetobacter TaxID=196816 RepID=UPI0020369AB6|nr:MULTISPECIES: O-acetyl-ADP-ribose deacetylase [unclassified Acinetobacter]USA46148.1 O-acetyl-ADP-ribose deacetylase [Acinetobacter sp. C26M]USA49632.1 O-acetyl-ADP-ribose deacetylase [Acinetobacter sp. C26G]